VVPGVLGLERIYTMTGEEARLVPLLDSLVAAHFPPMRSCAARNCARSWCSDATTRADSPRSASGAPCVRAM
jgi:hypothetical protein